jgi:hypothetical protein
MIGCSNLDITPFDLKECVFWTDSQWYLKEWRGEPYMWKDHHMSSSLGIELMCKKVFYPDACTLRRNHLGGCISYLPSKLKVAPNAFIL